MGNLVHATRPSLVANCQSSSCQLSSIVDNVLKSSCALDIQIQTPAPKPQLPNPKTPTRLYSHLLNLCFPPLKLLLSPTQITAHRAHLLPDQSLAGNLISRSKNLLSRSSCLSILKDFHPSLWPQEGGHIIVFKRTALCYRSGAPLKISEVTLSINQSRNRHCHFRKWFTLTTSLPPFFVALLCGPSLRPSLPPSLSPSSCQTFLAALALASILALKFSQLRMGAKLSGLPCVENCSMFAR